MKGKLRTLGNIGLALFLMSALLIIAAPVSAATAITNVWVEYTATTGNDLNNAGEHIIHFTTVTAMKRGVDTITVIYPTAFDLSGVQTGGQYYNVKGAATTYTVVDRSVTTGGQRIEVITPVDIPAGTAASLKVETGAVIKTGGSASFTNTVKIATSQDTTLVTSSVFPVDNTVLVALTSTSTYPSSLVAGAAAAYKYTFEVAGTVSIGGTVTIEFPSGTYLPGTISAANVFAGNGSEDPPVSAVVVDTAARTVTVTTAEALSSSGMVLYFNTSAGIKNPTTIGSKTVFMWTSVDGQKFIQDDSDTIVGGVATKLVFKSSTSDNATIINAFTKVLKLEAQDQYGNVNTGESTTVLVTVTTGTGTVHTAAGSSSNLWGSNQALSSGLDDVFYRPTTAGTHVLTATKVTGTTMTAGTFTITVAPEVVLKDANGNEIATYKPATTVYTADLAGGTYIQQAIDASFPGDTVELGEGIYELSSTLTLSQKITLTEASGASATLRPTSDNMLAIDVTTDGTAVNPIIIDGLTFDRLSSSVEFNRGVRVFGYNYVTVRNNTFNDIKPDTHADNPDGGVVIIAVSQPGGAQNSITSATISNNTFNNSGNTTPAGGGKAAVISIMVQNGIGSTKTITGVTISGNTITDSGGYAIVLNAGWVSGDLVTATISNNTLTNPYDGIGIWRNTKDVKVIGNTVTGAYQYALRVEAGDGDDIHDNLVIKNNTFTGAAGAHGRDATVIIDQDGGSSDPVTLQYNAIYDNDATYNIQVSAAAAVAGITQAQYNWFGSASGPGTTVSGVASDITTTPWLHKSLVDVVTDNASYPTFSRSLVVGWNTLSVPGKLISAADALDELVPNGMTIAYRYDGGWLQVTTYVLNPLDAIYIKMASAQTVLLKVDGAAFSVPTRALVVGWNLIGLASLTSKTDIQAIGSIPSTSFGQMVSPSMNASEWSYVSGSTAGTLVVGESYWIYLSSAATIAGFTILPMAPSLN